MRMEHFFASLFLGFPHDMAVVAMGAFPMAGLQIALSVAILSYKMNPLVAVFLAVLGSMIVPTLVLMFADRFHAWVQTHSGFFAKKWIKEVDKAQHVFVGKYEKYGIIGLMVFVALPLPGTGAWAGSLIAFVFGFPARHAWLAIFLGMFFSGLLTLLPIYGAGHWLQ